MSRFGILLLLGLVIPGFLTGCKIVSMPGRYPLDVNELEDRIAQKKAVLRAIQEEREREIQERGAPNPFTENKIQDLEDEISEMVRLRRRLINLERSGRISGPI